MKRVFAALLVLAGCQHDCPYPARYDVLVQEANGAPLQDGDYEVDIEMGPDGVAVECTISGGATVSTCPEGEHPSVLAYGSNGMLTTLEVRVDLWELDRRIDPPQVDVRVMHDGEPVFLGITGEDWDPGPDECWDSRSVVIVDRE